MQGTSEQNKLARTLCIPNSVFGVSSFDYVCLKVRIHPLHSRYKGVVAIDLQLEGVKMRLRPSMKKFEVPNVESAEIEIVQPFGYPINAYLNRYFPFANLHYTTSHASDVCLSDS
jgi:hypothetical protein